MGKGQPACDTAAEAWCPPRPPWMVAAKQNHVIAAKLNCGNASPAAGSPGWQEGIRPVMTPYSYVTTSSSSEQHTGALKNWTTFSVCFQQFARAWEWLN